MDRDGGDALHVLEFDELIREQPERPSGLAFGRLRARECNQMRFGLAGDLGGRSRSWFVVECGRKSIIDIAFADIAHGSSADSNRSGDISIADMCALAVIGGQENTRTHLGASRALA